MQMRINLDQIFGSTANQDISNISEYDSYQPSQSGTHQSNQNKYKLKFPIFDENTSETPKTTAKQHQPPPSKTPSVVTSNQTQYSEKAPGERLYYQSKMTIARKAQQLERLKLQKIKQQQKQITFKPKINKNSQKIVQNKGRFEKVSKKQSNKILPSYVKKQQQQIMHCTFKPELIAKSSSGMIRYKAKGQVFDQLFNDHRVKEVKKKLSSEQNQQEMKIQKKLTKTEFQNFLARNNEFMSKVEKKKQLIISTSKKFDLQTGHKLFSPKTNTFKSHKSYFTQKPAQKTVTYHKATKPFVESIKTKPIFSKNNIQQSKRNKEGGNISRENESRSDKNKSEKSRQQQNIQIAVQDAGNTDNIDTIQQIHQVKQDEQYEISDQVPHFQTVHGIQFQPHQQISPEQYQGDQMDYKANNGDQLEQQYENNSNRSAQFIKYPIEPINIGDQEEHEPKFYEQEDKESPIRNEDKESPIRNEQQKNSDNGDTHHEGEESRVQDP